MTKKVTISAYEFLKKFPDERAARLHIEERRWHGKPICPHCGSVERIQTRKIEGYFRCLSCKEDFTVRTGTIFERSPRTCPTSNNSPIGCGRSLRFLTDQIGRQML